MPADSSPSHRSVLFISKATPGDDEFALWLAPRLEAAGYVVFADILALDAGDRWRTILTDTLQNKAIKMLLCCSDMTLAAVGVDEEIAIACDLAKQLSDPKFIIPLRLENFKKKFGIGGLQYVNFVPGWAQGLESLLDTLKRQKVLRSEVPHINPHWEAYRRRNAVILEQKPERLTSNWMRVIRAPDAIRYFEPTGAVDRHTLVAACDKSGYPKHAQSAGFLSFGTVEEINNSLCEFGKFKVAHEYPLLEFFEEGAVTIGLSSKDASNIVSSMFRRAFERLCIDKGLLEYRYSKYSGMHVGNKQAKIGQRIPWGRQGDRRSSMLRNIAKGHVWQYGVTAIPAFWPFPHFKLKSRVLFAPPKGPEGQQVAGDPYEDEKNSTAFGEPCVKGGGTSSGMGECSRLSRCCRKTLHPFICH